MRLIDYDAAIDRYYAEYEKQNICDGARDRDFIKRCFDEAETVDASPVMYGRWIPPVVGKYGCLCSVCKKQSDNDYDYCPNCGAKMNFSGEWQEKRFVMINGDYVRSMPDEELVKFAMQMYVNGCEQVKNNKNPKKCKRKEWAGNLSPCDQCCLEWLKQERNN